MSKYTTEVRYICETYAGHKESQDYTKIDDVIANSIDKIFDFNFPIFDESYRSVLETKIVRHYYTREIGFETVALWKHFLNVRMNEIMPKYNKLYEAEALDFDPFANIDYTESYEGTGSGTNSNTDSGTNSNTDTGSISEDISDTRNTDYTHNGNTIDKFSDTPQGGLSGLLNDTYLTNARQTTANDSDNTDDDYTRDRNVTTGNTSNGSFNNTRNGRFSNTDEYLKHFKGYNGSKTYSEMLMEYRKTFINIDLMIIDELNDLFMGVW